MNAWCVTAATASCCQQLERTQDAQDRQKQEQKAKQNKPTKKGKIQFASCGCGFYLYFFSHKFTFVVFCSGLGICTLVQGLDTYPPAPFIASPPSNFLLPLYTFHSHCLFMSFCLCCLHSANCAIFKRRVLVFFTEFWTKPMCVCVCVGGGERVWALPSSSPPPIDAVPLPSLFCGWLSWIRRWRRNVARSMQHLCLRSAATACWQHILFLHKIEIQNFWQICLLAHRVTHAHTSTYAKVSLHIDCCCCVFGATQMSCHEV